MVTTSKIAEELFVGWVNRNFSMEFKNYEPGLLEASYEANEFLMVHETGRKFKVVVVEENG